MVVTVMHDGIAAHAPLIGRDFPGDPVAAYINGEFAWSPAQEAMFARKVRVSVEAGQPAAARFARVLDVERFAAGESDIGPFIRERQNGGHVDGTIYASLATVAGFAPETIEAVPRWWLAWYWQRPGWPSRAEVLNQLAAMGGPALDPARVWACQARTVGGYYDSSVVYGPQDWSR